jgi:DNA-binding MurR/RpiR family transcriptional regulator
VTRFVRALGYRSYGDFRVSLSAALKHAMAPVESFADAHGLRRFGLLDDDRRAEGRGRQSRRGDVDAWTRAPSRAVAKLLLKARRIFIVGAGASHHVAPSWRTGSRSISKPM